MNNPVQHFAELKNPRVERSREHVLEEILLIAIAAILSGANGRNGIEKCGKAKHEWLGGFLTMPGDIPSHNTFNWARRLDRVLWSDSGLSPVTAA